MPVSSKILKSLFGKSDNVAESVAKGSGLDSLHIPEEDVSRMITELGDSHGGFVPQDVEFNLDVDAGGGFGSADDVAKFSVTPAAYWKGYLGGDLFEPFRQRLLDRNQPGDPKALFYSKPSYGLEDTLNNPVDVFVSPTNKFDGGGAAGQYNQETNQLFTNFEDLEGTQNVLGHEITHALGHDNRLIPTEDFEYVTKYDPVLGIDEKIVPPPAFLEHMRRHDFSGADSFEEQANTMLSRYLADRGPHADNQLAAIMSKGPEFEEFMFELKQQAKLAYGEDFGLDEATNDKMIDFLLSEDVIDADTGELFADPDALIGGIKGDEVQGFELNKHRLQTMWDYASPEQKEIIRNGLHRAGAVGGAAVLGGLTDDE